MFKFLTTLCGIVSVKTAVLLFCVSIVKYRNHMHLKIIDHMNRITIYIHDITEHYPEIEVD
jgi:hypothetical protein